MGSLAGDIVFFREQPCRFFLIKCLKSFKPLLIGSLTAIHKQLPAPLFADSFLRASLTGAPFLF
ncbi:hypothetical protein BGM21_10625 [Geobacillus thermoleovorans]|nr:hypothetical protein BGM21_10625 [Geobacillus thermoleovorans]